MVSLGDNKLFIYKFSLYKTMYNFFNYYLNSFKFFTFLSVKIYFINYNKPGYFSKSSFTY